MVQSPIRRGVNSWGNNYYSGRSNECRHSHRDTVLSIGLADVRDSRCSSYGVHKALHPLDVVHALNLLTDSGVDFSPLFLGSADKSTVYIYLLRGVFGFAAHRGLPRTQLISKIDFVVIHLTVDTERTAVFLCHAITQSWATAFYKRKSSSYAGRTQEILSL